MGSMYLDRRGFVRVAGVIAATTGLLSLGAPETAYAESKTGDTTTATISWYTGKATSVLRWEPYEYVSFHSTFTFSHRCAAGSVIGGAWLTGGALINVSSHDYTNTSPGTVFGNSVTSYDVTNTDYGGMFNGVGSWQVPDYANFLLRTDQLSCSMYGLRSGVPSYSERMGTNGAIMLPVMGSSGNIGYAYERDLRPFGGASGEEMLEMVSRGYRLVNVYDEDGLSLVDTLIVECSPLEVIS